MKWRFAALGAAFLALCLFVLPIQAQTSETITKSTVRPWYDIAKEVTVTGTVSSVLTKSTPEVRTSGGTHLIVETSSGRVDASMGKFATKGHGALSVTAGERVQLTGVMKTLGGQQVFITRLVLANGKLYKIRNEYGFSYRPASRNASTKAESKGGQL
jgi:hypothetical protein